MKNKKIISISVLIIAVIVFYALNKSKNNIIQNLITPTKNEPKTN